MAIPLKLNHPIRYCLPTKKNCSKEAKRESWRKASKNYKNNYKDFLQISQVYKLGSGFLGCKPQSDFDKEYRSIVKERKRLKLKGLLVGSFSWIQFACKPSNESMLQHVIFPLLELYPHILAIAFLFIVIIVFGVYYK